MLTSRYNIMTFRRLIAFIGLCFFLSVGAARAEHFEDANAAYERGDYPQALKRYKPLALQGFANAQNNLGEMYGSGKGVKQDYKEALKWYRLASEQGHSEAQNHLGLMYYKGEGVLKDYVRAHMWLSLSADAGYQEAAKGRDTLTELMTAQQVAESERLAEKCKARQFKKCH
ncbi:MAG: tetratricopeptide repeat protein [Nitrosomonadaceae bacterium]